jgi:hypothetical protein
MGKELCVYAKLETNEAITKDGYGTDWLKYRNIIFFSNW